VSEALTPIKARRRPSCYNDGKGEFGSVALADRVRRHRRPAHLLRAYASAALRPLTTLPAARLACINVLKQSRLALDTTLDEAGNNKHVDRLVALRHWAEPLKLAQDRVTCHVLEAPDPAEAILDYARQNPVDQLLIGARRNSLLRKLLGSVSAKVVAEADCTVTIVRPPRNSGGPAEESAAV
jgi:eukaryotic-like serine/threonine-protein kinase